MQSLNFSVREIREAVRACAHLRIPDPAPHYLKEFLVHRVEVEDPQLAEKVVHLSTETCAELFRLLRALQRSGRDEPV